MSARSKVKRKDSTHKPIVDALEKRGWCVLDLSSNGGGCPDILVTDGDEVWFLMEIKVPGKKLRESQTRWHELWLKKTGSSIAVVESVAEALAVVSGRPYPIGV